MTGDDLDELNDREIADNAIALVRSIAEKWEEFREDAIYERNREVNRRHLEAQRKAASSGNDDKILQTTTSQH